jgi:hypothetical protein
VVGPKNLAIALSEFEVTVLSLNEPVANAELITKPKSTEKPYSFCSLLQV